MERVGVFTCSGCGIGEALDIEALSNAAEDPKPTCTASHPCLCAPEGIDSVRKAVDEEKLEGVILAACSSRAKQQELQLDRAATMVERVSLREQVVWSHPPNEEDTQMLAEDLLQMGMAKVTRAKAATPTSEPVETGVLVVGGGQAGLAIAARLTQLGVDTLIVDRWPRIGDNWRRRYHALTLHNQVQVNHLPYMPFPPNWPTYIPKDKLAGWFEAYAEIMDLNFWTGTEFAGGSYDQQAGAWSAALKRTDGTTRQMRPRHIVMATGVSGIPNLPDIPSLADFAGTVLHSGAYSDADEWTGRNVIVLGTGNSGHDIAQDLHSHGAHVTMIQRSPTLIVSVEPSAQLPYALYDEGPELADCDLLAASMPLKVARKAHQLITARSRELDRDLLERLARVGFRLDFGADDTGWQFKYLERGGGYYFNVGCSDLIADGEIGLVQFADIDRFVADGARRRNGDTLPADLIVLATGFKGQDYLVRRLFGDDIAARVGPVWGFDEDSQELRNMWMRTGQPGLWFLAGSFAQCRIYSKYLGLQIKAYEEGLIPPVRAAT